MAVKKKGLGKGLDSLIPDNKNIKTITSEKAAEEKNTIRETICSCIT